MFVKWTVKVLSLLLYIFISCQAQDFYRDFPSSGYNIIGDFNSERVDSQIRFFSVILTQYENNERIDLVQGLNVNRILAIYGIPEDIAGQCNSYGGNKSHRVFAYKGGEECRKLMDNVNFVGSFKNKVETINKYIEDISLNYKDWVVDYRNVHFEGDPVRNFYNFVMGNCEASNTTACFFHELAGNHFFKLRGRKPSHPHFSIHQELYLTYYKISLALLKGHVTEVFRVFKTQYDWSVREKTIAGIKSTFVDRVISLGKIVVDALRNAPRDILPGDPPIYQISVNYMRLKWFAEQIIVNEANLNPTATCWNTCADYKTTTFYEYGNTPSKGNDVCYGVIHNCFYQPLGRLCPRDPFSSRRYGAIKGPGYGGVKVKDLGNNFSNCRNSNFTDDIYYVRASPFDRCDVCTCFCDDFRNPKTLRTFSLKPVTSDVQHNMVITGLRIREIQGVFYIQIQQGYLGPRGHVDAGSVDWKPVESFDPHDWRVPVEHYFTLRYLFERSVNLRTIINRDPTIPKNIRQRIDNFTLAEMRVNDLDSYVLTGIRFEKTRLDFQLTISARFTHMNILTGKLNFRDKWDGWVNSDEPFGRHEVKIHEADIPTNGPEENTEVRGDDLYVKFQATDNVKDFGQTTVPFLDIQDVVSDPPVPLSGAGLYYKGQPGYGGFIGIKLMSFDFSRYVSTSLR